MTLPPSTLRGDGLVAARGRRAEERGDRLAGGCAHGAVTGRRHDGGGGDEEAGVVDRQRLGDHAAHGHAHHVRPVDPQLDQQRGRVVRHVLDPVGGRRGVAPEERPDVGQAFELGGQAAVAVVEADEEEPLAQALDETLRPGDELGAEAHHEKHGWTGRIALGDVLDVDPVHVCGWHAGAPFADAAGPSPTSPPAGRAEPPPAERAEDNRAGSDRSGRRRRVGDRRRPGPGASAARARGR